MKELKILNKEEISRIMEAMSGSCGLPVPQDESQFDRITVHLYQIGQDNDYTLQLRWGMHKIFHHKHLSFEKRELLPDALIKIIAENCREIRKNILQRCQENLETIVNLELEPLINKQFSGLLDFKIGISKKHQPGQSDPGSIWPVYTVFIAWTDEYGEFQEYLHPIRFEEELGCFHIPVEQIALSFRRYRDSLI